MQPLPEFEHHITIPVTETDDYVIFLCPIPTCAFRFKVYFSGDSETLNHGAPNALHHGFTDPIVEIARLEAEPKKPPEVPIVA